MSFQNTYVFYKPRIYTFKIIIKNSIKDINNLFLG